MAGAAGSPARCAHLCCGGLQTGQRALLVWHGGPGGDARRGHRPHPAGRGPGPQGTRRARAPGGSGPVPLRYNLQGIHRTDRP